MKQALKLVLFIAIAQLYVGYASAFTCRTALGQTLDSGSANVYVNLTPSIAVNQNLVVDLSNSISCKNDSAASDPLDTDYINLTSGSAYGGVLQSFTGTVYWNGNSYPLPMNSDSSVLVVTNRSYSGLPLKLYLKASGAAGGVVVNSGELIAVLKMYKVATFNGGNPKSFTWNIYAANSVVVPTGGCDVSSRDVTVSLPNYPGTASVPLTVRCSQNQSLAFYLTGTTDTSNNIFKNVASSSAASGVGIQLVRNSNAITTNSNVSLGTVGTSSVSLGLSTRYARTSGQVTAGTVQSVIGVTFVYQ